MKKRYLSFIASILCGTSLNAFTYNIVDGNQMLGAVENITDFSPFENKCVNYIYHTTYLNGEQNYVRNINSVMPGSNLQLINLNKGDGFILNASGSCIVNIAENAGEIVFKGLTYKTVVSQQTGRVWLDRNLGATKVCDKTRSEFSSNVAYANSQRECFGDYYQWGRKTDGHQLVNSIKTASLQTHTQNTNNKFSYSDTPRYDWVSNTDDPYGNSRTTFWNKDDGTSICPPGFKVPTVSEWSSEAVNRNNVTSILKIPYSGYKTWSDGVLIVEGGYTKVWTQTSYQNLGAKALTFSDSYVGTGSFDSYERRASGLPVRCIKKLD